MMDSVNDKSILAAEAGIAPPERYGSRRTNPSFSPAIHGPRVTIDSFALELMKSLEAYARSNGIPFEPPNEGKAPAQGGGHEGADKGSRAHDGHEGFRVYR